MAKKHFTCDRCSASFLKEVNQYNRNIKRGSPNLCEECHKPQRVQLACEQCSKPFSKKPTQFRKTKHHYCSRSCAAIWHNAHKTSGTNRSKMEVFLETQIKTFFPSIECLYNNTFAIGAELDFYFPTLRLAIELNGVVHYEPIYGPKTFKRIKNKDNQKCLSCFDAGIELIIVPNLGDFSKKLSAAVWESVNTIILSRIQPTQ